jgi:hypothetical protein
VGAQNLVQVAYLLGRKVSVVLVTLFSCLLEKIFPSDRYFIGGGWNSGCSECVLSAWVGWTFGFCKCTLGV